MPTPLNLQSYPAGSDFSSKQFYLCHIESTGDAILPTAITDNIIGVVQNKPADGEAATVCPIDGGGSSYCVLGATLAKGARVATSTTGKTIAAASTADCIGTLRVGGDDTEIGEIQLGRPQPDA